MTPLSPGLAEEIDIEPAWMPAARSRRTPPHPSSLESIYATRAALIEARARGAAAAAHRHAR